MKAVVIKEPNTLLIEERAIPEPQAHQVRIKVRLAGICGSDSHIYRGHNPFAKYPRIIGHEFFGIIDKVGNAVDSKRIGERVSIDPVLSCGHCYPCSIGKPNVCETLEVLGVHTDGGFTEYVTVPADNAYTIPDNIPDEHAVTVEPYSIAANVTSHVKPNNADIALVYGAGTIGLTCAQVLKGVYQVKTLIVVDRVAERLARATACGADIVIDNSQIPLPEQLKALNIRPTLVLDAACHPSIMQEAILIASPAARVSIMGFSSEASSVTQQSITSKEISLFSSRLNAKKFPEVIDWIANKKIDPSKILTHQFAFTDTQDAILTFEKDQKTCCKILLTF
ncbi:Zn-dependent oxidoreductase [Providencia sp. Je.9.19]|uniref:Zn-dependent oxidoreductase n=1 Tax=Providencia sp. Je.9.19 TaxID=3142844 RepID=UPI003DA8D2B0